MINLNELTSHHPAFHNIVASHLPHYFAGGPQASNHSGNDFRHARKCQTIRETTFAMRGNTKPFGKWLSPCAETPNHSGNDFRYARKLQTFRETTFAERGETRILYTCSITKNGMHKKLHTTFYLNVMLFYLLTRSLTCSEGSYNPGRVLVCGLNLHHLISKQGG